MANTITRMIMVFARVVIMAKQGWIKVYRGLLDDPLIDPREPHTKVQAWVELLLMAEYEAGERVISGQVIRYERGDIVVSEQYLAVTLKWSKGKVRRFISVLRSMQRVVTRKTNVTSIISIVNYDKHQGGGNADGNADGKSDGNSDGNSDGKQVKEVKKQRSKETKKAPVFEFPEKLNTDTFKAVWGEYVTHRKEISKPITPTSAKKTMSQLDKMGHDAAIAAIEHSIANGWQGIFPPKGSNGKPIKPKEETVYRNDPGPRPKHTATP
jgi:hypothetical protein